MVEVKKKRRRVVAGGARRPTPEKMLDRDGVVVWCGDCLDVMAAMPEDSVDTIVTDPPYGLEFMGKDWDKLDKDLPQEKVWKGRHGKGGSSVGNDRSKPSSRHRVSFGSKRSAFKRCTICGKRQFSGTPCKCKNPTWKIEYPDGPPSSAVRMQRWHERWARAALRVAKPGATALVFGGTRTYHRLACAMEDAGWEIRNCMMWVYGSGFPKSHNVSKAIDERTKEEIEAGVKPSEDVQTWNGYGSALKPAWEPIIVAMKPLDGTFAENALKHGVSGLWIDGGRVGTNDKLQKLHGSFSFKGTGGANEIKKKIEYVDAGKGRWPANLVLQHDPRCVRVGTEPDPGYAVNRFVDGARPFGGARGEEYETVRVPDGEREVWACVPGCPVRMLDGQSGERPGATSNSRKNRTGSFDPGLSDKKPGFGDSGGASRFFYTAKASTTERRLGLPPGFKNLHPTVKPLDLCRYLCRLTRTPTGGTVLDPFAGSGSISVGAILEGRPTVAVEMESESAKCCVARIEAALKYGSNLQKLKPFKLKKARRLKRRRIRREPPK